MNAKEISKGIVLAILQLLGIAIVLWLLLQLQTLLIYMIIAGVISLIGRPINQFFITTPVVLVLNLFKGFISISQAIHLDFRMEVL